MPIGADLEANKQVVRRHLAASDRGDVHAQGALLAEDVRWWIPQSGEEHAHIARPLEGKEAVLGLFANGDAFFTDRHTTIDQIVAEGDYVAVHSHMQARTASGNDYLNQYHWLFRLEGARIAEVWEHLDTAYAFARMAP